MQFFFLQSERLVKSIRNKNANNQKTSLSLLEAPKQIFQKTDFEKTIFTEIERRRF